MDFRTWSASTKIEVFYQNNLIDSESYAFLSKARKSRNSFIHDGTAPTQASVKAALTGLFYLLSLVSTEYKDKTTLIRIIHEIEKVARLGIPSEKQTYTTEELRKNYQCYMELPPSPGNPNWDEEEYEIIDELRVWKKGDLNSDQTVPIQPPDPEAGNDQT